jgi:hypothetical protein
MQSQNPLGSNNENAVKFTQAANWQSKGDKFQTE